MVTMSLLLKVHVFATLCMAGVIWSVQVIQYPLFACVGLKEFTNYHAAHVRRISFVVVPLMLVELSTGGLLLFLPTGLAMPTFGASLILLAICWLTTFLFHVPQHNSLGQGYSAKVQRALVTVNWVRTVAWTARAILLLYLLPGSGTVF